MKKKFIYLLTTISLFSINKIAISQEYAKYISEEIYESIIESFAEELEGDGASISILEDLNQLIASPLNLNNATIEELEKLFFLNDFQKENLLTYREKFGQIYSYFEIENIDGFNRELSAQLVPFTVLGENENIHQVASLRQEINLRTNYTIEKADGFIADEHNNKKYYGIRPALYSNYRASYGEKYRWGFTLENDPGEAFFKNSNQHGFDYNSAYLSIKTKSIFDQVIIGDYGIRFGQGLIQWTGYSTRKSLENPSIRYFGQGIRPYTSASENANLRGAATELKFSNFNAVVFASSIKVDANRESNDSLNFITTLQNSGYHRTLNEIEDENSLQATRSGVALHYHFNNLAIGFNGIYQHFNLPLIPADRLYNLFKFNGQNNYNVSFDFHARTNKISLFGESAICKSNGKAILIGSEIQPANQLHFSALYRNIDADFHTIGGSALTEWQGVQNEKGLYTSITLLPFPKVEFSTTTDFYQSKWMRYQSNAPVRGTEWNNQLKYQLTNKFSILVRHKMEERNEKESNNNFIKEEAIESIQRIRFQVEYKPSDQLRVRARLESSNYNKQDSAHQGLLTFIEFNCHSVRTKLNLNARIACFNIDDYQSRIYTYEQDMPSLFYIPSFSGKGFRYYLVSSFRINKNCTVYAKAAQVLFSKDVVAISTGDNEIKGNHKSNLKFQIKYRF